MHFGESGVEVLLHTSQFCDCTWIQFECGQYASDQANPKFVSQKARDPNANPNSNLVSQDIGKYIGKEELEIRITASQAWLTGLEFLVVGLLIVYTHQVSVQLNLALRVFSRYPDSFLIKINEHMGN